MGRSSHNPKKQGRIGKCPRCGNQRHLFWNSEEGKDTCTACIEDTEDLMLGRPKSDEHNP